MMFSRSRNYSSDVFPQLHLGNRGLSGLMRRLTSSPRSDMFRAAWAEAEVVIPSMLAQGHHPLYLQRLIERELADNFRSTYRHEFFLACQRILTNLRGANLFAGLPSLGEYEEICMERDQRLGFECMMYRRYSGLNALVRGMMVDSETEVQLAGSRALDAEAESELRNIRERERQSQAQRYQGNAASLRELQAELADARFRAETAEAQLEITSRGGTRNGASSVGGGSTTYETRASAPAQNRLESRREASQRSDNNFQSRLLGNNNSVGARGREVVRYDSPPPFRQVVDNRSIASTGSSRGRGQEGFQYGSSSRDRIRDTYGMQALGTHTSSQRSRGQMTRFNGELRNRYVPSTTIGSIATSRSSQRGNGGNGPSYNDQIRRQSRHHQARINRDCDFDAHSRSMHTVTSASGDTRRNARQYGYAPFRN